jgi:GTP-binding protein EngB required for normal cell division
MENPLNTVSDLPKPVQILLLVGSGAGLATVFMAISTNDKAWKIAAAGLIAVGLVMVLFKLVLILWDKRKSGPFSQMIARTASGRGASDPAQKARMDDLRKKFEEGVLAFKAAGKDLYSLPWYMVVGPAGSGKTEMVRRSNVGFPPGLQDVLQGSGGTLNMHWWFTNHAVMLDTAGRMFMEEAGEGQSSEWKEFLKLLRSARAHCPINGLLLVIPSESLLKDAPEKIDRTAGAIARQLDVIQRILEVRFPVTVVITKCDKIVGFREFFESVTDPVLQHQILGWSNPGSLDDAFKPDEVEKHMDQVRDKLTKRRAGLLQNPIHTTDPNGRRTDEVDELYELPGNMMRIAPRLRQYLEKIFVAGEWSPKPLFLRGIYFTSSMREGQALDVALAQALGVDADSLQGGKEYDREKAYFLKDVFLGKVFKERGLVTRAAHVGKAVAAQRRWIILTALVSSLLVGGATLASIWGYRGSFEKPRNTWDSIRNTLRADAEAKGQRPLALFVTTDGKLEYKGAEKPGISDVPEDVKVRSDLLTVSGDETGEIPDPLVAKPVLTILKIRGKDFQARQIDAHRAIVESKVLKPLIDAARLKLRGEQNWDDDAIGALSQLVRLTTLAEGKAPIADPWSEKAGAEGDFVLVSVESLARYALGTDFTKAFPNSGNDVELKKLQKAVGQAYPLGFPGKGDLTASGPSESLFNNDRDKALTDLVASLNSLAAKVAGQTPSPSSELGKFVALVESVKNFESAESAYVDQLAWLAAEGANSPGEAAAKGSVKGYNEFAAAYKAKYAAVDSAKDAVAALAATYKDEDLNEPTKLLGSVQEGMKRNIEAIIKSLSDQLPEKGGSAGSARLATLESLFDQSKAASIPQSMRESLKGRVDEVGKSLTPVASLLANGKVEAGSARLYQVLAGVHKLALDALTDGEKAPSAEPSVSAVFGIQKLALATRVKDQNDRLDKRMQWNTASTDGTARLQRTVGAARRVAGIAQMRGLYGLAVGASGEPLWADGASLEKAVGELPDEIVTAPEKEGGQPVRVMLKSPTVPLSELEEPVSYDRKYIPEAAIRLVGAWRDIRALTENPSSGQIGAIAREELAKAIATGGTGDAAVEAYARKYVNYWKRLACEMAMPSSRDYDSFKRGIKDLAGNESSVADALEVVRDRSRGALEKFVVATGPMKIVDDARKQIDADYAGLAAPKSLETLIKTWGKAFSGSSAEARETLRISVDKRLFKEDYALNFGGAGENANYLKYRDQFVLKAIDSLIRAGGGDTAAAWRELSETKGIPLASGAESLADLSEAQMESLRTAVSKLGGKAGAKREGGERAEDIRDPELRAKVREMCGEDYLSADGRQEWFAAVRSILNATKGSGVKATIQIFDGAPPKPANAGTGKFAGDTYTRAGFWKGGQKTETRLTNIDTGGKSTVLELALPTDQATEIRLFSKDPQNVAAAEDAPDAKIVISPGRWGPLAAMLTSGGEAVRADDGKSYRVLVKTPDGSHYLWLVVTLDTTGDDKLPDLKNWPRADKWPPN